jgi:hypothetical protein
MKTQWNYQKPKTKNKKVLLREAYFSFHKFVRTLIKMVALRALPLHPPSKSRDTTAITTA